jgi:hypothetical protein
MTNDKNNQNKKETKQRTKEREKKLIIMKKHHTCKRMRFAFFLQTSNLHPIKQK